LLQHRIANAAARNAEERQQRLAQLKTGDCIDAYFSDMGVDGGWLVSKIVGSSATRFTVHPLYWSRKDDSDFERAIELLQPYCSQTGGMYTGSEDFRKHVTIAPALPILQAIPLHEHPLQRFLIECSYMCDGCQHRQEPNKAERFYVCLVCDYGFCTKCFVGAGGVDTHPLPCEPPPAKPIQHENLDRVEFVDELKEHECAVCLSAAHKPVLLPGCGQ
jgi:hypothetical protein